MAGANDLTPEVFTETVKNATGTDKNMVEPDFIQDEKVILRNKNEY